MTQSRVDGGKELANELHRQSEVDASVTPMDAVTAAARAGNLTDDQLFRLVARLWTLKRMMYYVYGGWAQGINLNDYPPTVAYLFGRQTYDESTQEMQFCDEILKRRCVRTQRQLFFIKREEELMNDARANTQPKLSYFGMTAMFPHIHPWLAPASTTITNPWHASASPLR
jgi:hypothetical protein